MAPLVAPILGLITNWFSSKQKISEAKVTAQIDRIAKGQDDSGWKDEFILLLIGFPYIMAFIPNAEVHDAALNGFQLLDLFPDWWKYSFLTIVGTVYGSKKLRNFSWGKLAKK